MTTKQAPPVPAVGIPTKSPIYNEMRIRDGLHPDYVALDSWLKQTSAKDLERKHADAQRLFNRRGITFAVYGERV